jgi:hypothetical protein
VWQTGSRNDDVLVLNHGVEIPQIVSLSVGRLKFTVLFKNMFTFGQRAMLLADLYVIFRVKILQE